MLRIRGLTPETILRLLLHRPIGNIDPRAIGNISVAQHVFLCVADHFEPMWQGAPQHVQQDRIGRWRDGYPALVEGLSDVRGRLPQHTFFYPAEEYDASHLETLARLCEQGYGDVEVHLHHDNDTSEQFRDTLETFTETLHNRHGLLRRRADGKLSYGFIHGNWTLDNSHPEGRWCGVNDEISILAETGCYADFTLPSAPSPCQTRTINSIYYAIDDPQMPKSHDRGIPAQVGRKGPDGALLMIQGPLMLDWRRRKCGVLPRIENGDLHGARAATFSRFRQWHNASVGVVGRANWRFVKIHTHGCDPANDEILLGEPMRQFHQELSRHAESNAGFKYYYVTAHEMAMLVHQAEQGEEEPIFPVV